MRYRFYFSGGPDHAFRRHYQNDQAAFAAALGRMKDGPIEGWQGTRLVFRVSPPVPQIHASAAGRNRQIAAARVQRPNAHPG